MIKLFESFKEIKDICEEYEINNYTINSDGSIDVNGNVEIAERLKSLPLKFNHVTGNFRCNNNELTSLSGAPREVDGDFWCDNNQLTSLEGCPQKVGTDFFCYRNRLTSLIGAPSSVKRFDCGENELKSLEGAPRKAEVFWCDDNKIWTFEGAPDHITDKFYCTNNPIWNIWRLFDDYSKMELFDYYDIIREVKGKPAIVLDRLNDFLEEIRSAPVEKIEGYLNI